jgi:surfeit locus 1 family protein
MTANLAVRAPVRLFRPSMIATCLMLALVSLFVSLGNWQYRKAQDKLARQAVLEQRLMGPALDVLDSGLVLRDIEYGPVRLHGAWEATAGFLLDNQVFEGQAGYVAITPFRLEGSGVVLVNRGWLPAAADHREVPAAPAPPAGASVKGLAVAVPRAGLQLAGASNEGPVHAWIDVVAAAKQLGAPVAEWMLIVDREASDGLRVEWPRPAERVQTNLGYAFQWYGFGLAAVGIWLWHGWRRARGEGAP